ncbi:hypothetical protein [Planctomonas psychrotolerans]|uniref:hypothetical protein n=1 Tax=Planctomonas psychrotolerans TaxID=2528712 RepID=UPI00123AFA3D|nr:hypothetical protein [Planctomonas psychrotolerans]
MTADAAPRARAHAAPPPFADPRRIGTVVGLIGAVVFVFSYTTGFSDPLVVAVRLLCIACVSATLWFLFAAPRFLGPFLAPRAWQIGTYVACVVIEFVVIAAGGRWLEEAGNVELRPALIGFAVGLHFVPFAWAFKERMFYTLGGTLMALGAGGLLVGTGTSALVAAVGCGVAMSVLLLAYTLGAFAGGRKHMNPSST